MGKVIFRDTELSSSNSTYELAVANGYKGTKEEFYKMLITVSDKANKSDTYTKTEVDTAINNHKIDVDSALSDTSENPVQNKIITSALNGTLKKWVGTKADYDKLTSYDDNTIYIVTDQDGDTSVDSKSFSQHVQNTNNPHKVTASQVGALAKSDIQTVTATLTASLWSNKQYSFESTYPSAKYDVEVGINGDSATDDQYKAWASLKPMDSMSNILKIKGKVPTVDIPVILKVVSK